MALKKLEKEILVVDGKKYSQSFYSSFAFKIN